MADPRKSSAFANPGAALAEAPLPVLLGSIVDGLLQAQDQLDARAARSAAQYVDTPAGTLAMPPLWYAFRDVRVDLEMSASVAAIGAPGAEARGGGTFMCRLVNPASVSLFGYQASAGLRVTLQLGVMGAMPLKRDPAPDAPTG